MTWIGTPWAIGGGARHTPEVARLLAYASTAAAEGIVTAGDLKVVPLSTPGTGVRVLAGAALIRNRYPGASQQTYVAQNPTEDLVTGIEATTSLGGRSDLIVARILDPQYEGSAPADPVTFQYAHTERIPNVPPTTKSARDLNLAYPAVALARIDFPASTGTITEGMIVDLRQLALPREQRRVTVNTLTDQTLAPTGDVPTYTDWPASFQPTITIPSWATHAEVMVTLTGIVATAGNLTGYLRTLVGSTPSAPVGVDIDLATTASARESFQIFWGADVRALAGTTQTVKVQGYLEAGQPGVLRSLAYSQASLDVQFSERAV